MNLSACCHAKIRLNKVKNKKVKRYYICNKCGYACDIIKGEKITRKQKNLYKGK